MGVAAVVYSGSTGSSSRSSQRSEVALRHDSELKCAFHQAGALLVLGQVGDIESFEEDSEVVLHCIDTQKHFISDLAVRRRRRMVAAVLVRTAESDQDLPLDLGDALHLLQG